MPKFFRKIGKGLIITIAILAGLFYIFKLSNTSYRYSLLEIFATIGVWSFVAYKIGQRDKCNIEACLELDKKKDELNESKEEINLLNKEISSRDKRVKKIAELCREIQATNKIKETEDTEDVYELFDKIQDLEDRTFDVGID